MGIFKRKLGGNRLGLITLAGTVTALTETKADDKWLDVLKRILNAIILGRSK